MNINKRFPPSVSLVIPLYNNGKTLVKQLISCRNRLGRYCSKFEIIVCDDASKDNSLNLLKDFFSEDNHFKILLHSKNQGIAKTIYELYKKASSDYIFLFSVDGDWNPDDIPRMLDFLKKNNFDVVIGKRDLVYYTPYRKLVSFMYNFFPFLLFGVNTKDAGSIKLFKRDIIKKIPLISHSVFFEAELLIKAKKKGFSIGFIPISFKKIENYSGKGAKLRNIFESLYDLIKLRLLWK